MNVNYISLSNGRDTKLKKTWQKKLAFLLFFVMFSFISVNAQIDVASSGGTPTASYLTLKGAFDAINGGTHTGTITIGVSGNTTETASAVLNASGSGSASYATITISPTGGGARTISGAIAAGSPMIDLNGADNVTINGLNSGGNALTISNTTVAATSGTSTIRFQTDATSNTITNCSILGSSTVASGTSGGNIWFGSAAVTTGNDNNTISNCNIGPAGSNLPTKCITFTGSSNAATGNSGNTITGNNFFDYFHVSTASSAIEVNSGTPTCTITNNKFYQTATRTQTTGVAHRAININNSSGDNYTVTGNTIGYNSNAGTGTYTMVLPSSGTFIGIAVSTGSTNASAINSNTIANIALSGALNGTGSSAPFRGIYVGAGLTTCNSNTIGSQSATGAITFTSSSASAGDVIGIFNFGSANWTTNNNNIGGISVANSSTGAANLYGIRANTSSTVTWTATGNTIGGSVANSMSSTSTAAGTMVHGIDNVSPAATFTGNTIRNMNTAGGTGTTSSSAMIGIMNSATSANHTIGTNTIYNLSSTLAGASTVNGIFFGSSTGANIVERNLVYDLTATGTTGIVNGIFANAGTATYRNNMVRLGTAGTVSTVGMSVSGINEIAGTNNMYHNSVYIGGAPINGAINSFAFQSVVTTNTRAYLNNIFVNARSNSGSTGKHYAIRVGGTAVNPAGLTSNGNIFYAGGTGGFTGLFNAVDRATIGDWRTATGQDAGSFTDNAPFVAATATTPDLHLNSASSTFAEGLGVTVASVTTDFDGETRSGLTPIDIGADALAGTGPSVVVINSVAASPSGTGLCTAVSRTITANTTAGGSAITSVTLNYSVNGVAQTPIAMTGGTTTGTSDWTATIPVASPVNAAITWSVTAVDPILAKNTVGTPYQDEPLFGTTAAATATPASVCAGSTITLNGIVSAPGARTLGAGATTSSTTAATFFPGGWGGAKTQYIVKASELTAAGLLAGALSSLAFDVVTVGQTYQGFNVQIGHTAATAMTTTFLATPMTQVYRGTLTDDGYLPTTGINTLAFGTGSGSSSSFTWNGTDNIVISICWSRVPAAATSTATSMRVDATGFTSSAYDQTDNATPAAECATVTGDGTGTNRPKFTFVGSVSTPMASYSWVDNATSTVVGTTNPLTVTPTVNTTYTVTMATAGGCTTTATTNAVTIIALPSVPTATPSTQCGSGVPTASVTSTTGAPTPTFKWYAASTGGTALQTSTSTTYTTSISTTTTFYVTEVSGTCESAPRTAVTVTVNTPPAIIISNVEPLTQCGVGTFTGDITASSTNDPAMTYVWSVVSGPGTITSDVAGAMTYSTTASTIFRATGTPVADPTCGPVIKDVTVSVFPLPLAALNTDVNGVCAGGGSAHLTSNLNAGNFSSTSITYGAITPPVDAITLTNNGVGTPVPQTFPTNTFSPYDDGGWGSIPMGFNFNFFGATYTTINVGTNGTVQFGTFNANGDTVPRGLSDFGFVTLPSTTEPFNMVAVLAMDNDLSSTTDGGVIKYWTQGDAPNRKFVVAYILAKEFADTKYSTAQAIFYETTGVIEVHVTSSTNQDRNKLIGINNGDGTIGALAYSSGTTATANNPIVTPFAYRFTPPSNYTTTWSSSTTPPFDDPLTYTVFATGTNLFGQTVNPSVSTRYALSYTNQTTGCTNELFSSTVTIDIISNVAPTATAVSNVPTICLNGSANLSLTGNVNSIGNTDGLTYQWQVSTDGGTVWTNISGATSATTTVTPTVPSMYQALVSACGGTAVASSPVSIGFTNTIDSTTPATRCGTGTVSLAATSPSVGASIKWYAAATGGTALSTGSPFVTPSISTTTTYYVAAETTGPACSSIRVPVVATVTTAPTINLTGGSSAAICSGGETVTLTTDALVNYDTFNVTPVTGVSNGDGTFTFSPIASTVYTVTATQSTGDLCATTFTYTVTVNTTPIAASASAAEVCLENNAVTLNASSTYVNTASTGGAGTGSLGGVEGNPYRSGNGTGNQIRTQLLVTAGELTAAGLVAGNITSLAFTTTAASTGTVADFSIAMGHTSATALTTTFETTSVTPVFSVASFTPASTGLNVHTFSSPFTWDGVSNVLINVCQTNDVSGTATVVTETLAYNATTHRSGSVTGCTDPTGGSSLLTRPIMQFGFSNAPATTYAWTSTPSGFTASGASVTANPTVTTTYHVVATNTVTGCDSAEADVTVTVNSDPVDPITGGASSVCLGSPSSPATIPATIDFDSSVGVIWESSNPAVATIDVNGVLQPLTAGTTVISAYIFNEDTDCITHAPNSVSVNVYAPLSVTSNPGAFSQLEYDGVTPTTSTFTVVANGVSTYQWQVSTTNAVGSFTNLSNGGIYSGVTTATLTVSNATSAENGLYYRALLTGNSPCVSPLASGSALFTVSDLAITEDPDFGEALCTTGDRTITVGVTPAPPTTTITWFYSEDNGASYTVIDGSPIGDLTFTGDVESTSLEMVGLSVANNGWLIQAVASLGANEVTSNPTEIVVNSGAVIDTLTPVLPETVCNASVDSATFTVTATGATGYQWQYSTDNADWGPVTNGVPTGATYTNATTATLNVATSVALVAGPHYYRAVVSSEAPCDDQFSNSAQLLINTPTVNVSSSSSYICNPGGSATLTASGTAATYSWSPATGLNVTTGDTVIATPTVTTTYTVTGTETGGCTNTASVTVTVNTALVVAATATPATVCSGANSQLLATVTNALTNTASNYTFERTTNAYTPLTGDTSFDIAGFSGDLDDGVSFLQPIGFDFTLAGNTFDDFSVNTNGYLTLGDYPLYDANYAVMTTADEINAIAFNSRDFNNTSAVYSYVVEGTSPNRICKIQASNFHRYDTSTHTGNAQVWLYETTNVVEIHYGTYNTAWLTGGAGVGIKGSLANDVRSISSTTWAGVTSASATTSTTSTITQATTNQVVSGTVYRFTPPVLETYTYSWSPTTFLSDPAIANPVATAVTATTEYTVAVTSSTGCTKTQTVTVNVAAGIAVTTPPAAASFCQGTTATLSVVATGAGLTYQWRKGGVNVTGATSATLTIPAAAVADSGSYDVVINSVCADPTETTTPVTLTINPTPTATAPAAFPVTCSGSTTSAITLNGTPVGVTFDITGGTAIGLANQTGVTAIPSFTATTGTAVLTITPKANGCTGTAITYAISVNPTPGTVTVTPETSTICVSDTTPVLLTISGGAVANSNIVFGTGTTANTATTYPSPLSNYYGGTKHQMLIRATELTAKGFSAGDAISGITFGVESVGTTFTGTLNNYSIAVGNTAATVLNGSSFQSGLTTVRAAAAVTVPTTGLPASVSIPFDSGFTWNGTSNIVIQTSYSNANTGTSTDFVISRNSDPGFVSTNYYRVDGGTAATVLAATIPSGSGNARPNFLLARVPSGAASTTYTWTSTVANSFTDITGTTHTNTATGTSVYVLPSATATITGTVTVDGCSNFDTATVTVDNGVTYYADTDGDTFGNPLAPIQSCTGAPVGYVSDNTDCNDADATKHATFPFYVDADNDTYGTGASTVAACAVDGSTPPVGYSLNNTDCNDGNSAIYQNQLLYVDADGDTYDAGQTTVCMGATVPAGYSATTSGSDCNDANPAVYQSANLYTDADGDGYDAGTGQELVCYGPSVPAGYSLTTLGTDCNDLVFSATNECVGSTVNLTMLIEGYYAGGGTMTSVRANQVEFSDPADVEEMTIELHAAAFPYDLVDTTTAMLHTDGTLSASFTTAAPDNYYIVVKGSNIVQTWSATPQAVGATVLSYDFTSAASQAYGDNQAVMFDGAFAMMSGDLNYDDIVDTIDFTEWEGAYIAFTFGLAPTDLNGDGIVDTIDYVVWETSYLRFTFAAYPFE